MAREQPNDLQKGPPCERCGSTDTYVSCLACDTHTAEEVIASLNLPPRDMAAPYEGEGKESVMEALVKTAGQRDASYALLRKLLDAGEDGYVDLDRYPNGRFTRLTLDSSYSLTPEEAALSAELMK